MKNRKFIVLVAVALLVVISATLVACNTGKGSVSYTISYVVDGEVKKTAELDNFSKVNGFYKPTKEGYTFDGWYLDTNFTEKLSSDNQLKDNLTLYAKFTRKSYTVEFVGADDMIIESQTVFHGEPAIAPEPPAVSGMKFVGWDVDFTAVTANLTVKALYEESTKFRAEFFSLGTLFWSYDFEPGEDINLILNTALDEIVVPEGLRFVKWVTSSDEDVPSVLPNDDIDIFAVYELVDIEYLNIVGNVTNYENITYAPDASITYSADMPIISGDEYEIFYSYLWTINGVEQTGTSSSLTVSGLDVGTYEIKVVATATATSIGTVSKEATLTLTVSPANMEVSAVGGTITYDGQAHNITVNSLPGDVVEYKVEGGDWTSNLELVNAGTYNVYYKVSRENYNTYEPMAPVTYTIEKKVVTATADDQTVIFGDVVAGYSITFEGMAEGEDPAKVIDTWPNASSHYIAGISGVGTYKITISGGSDDNYTFEYVGGTLTVNPKDVTITANDMSITYGDAVNFNAHTYTHNGIVSGDTVVVTYTTDYTTGANAGETFEIIPSLNGTYANYNFNFENGTLTVNPKDVTITANDMTITYGDAVNFNAHTYTHNGIVSGDTVDVTYTTNYEVGDGAGTYTITSALNGTYSNYNFTFENGTLTVNPKDVTVAVDDKTIVYGEAIDTVDLTYTLTGALDSDTVDVTLEAVDYVAGAVPGTTFTIKATSTDNRYKLNVTNGTLEVSRKNITVTAGNGTVVYGSEADLSAVTSEVVGLVGEDTLNVTYTTNYKVGDGAGKSFNIVPAGAHDYYIISFVYGTLEVAQRPAIVTVNDASVIYGDQLPTLTAVVTGTVLGDSLDYDISADYVAGVTAVGGYTITATPGVNNNYDIKVFPGTLTINKKAISYNFEAETAKSWSNSSWANAGLVAGHVASGTLTLTATELGTYTFPDGFEWTTAFDIKAGEDSVLSNYDVNFTVTVALIKRDFEFTAEDKTVTYDGNAHTIEVTNVKLDEEANQNYTVEYSLDGETWATDAPSFVNVGDYKVFYRITPEDSVYYPDRAEGFFNLHITVKTVTVTVDSKSKTYGETTPLFTGKVEGVVEGDAVEINYLLANNAVDKNVGEYTITAQFAEAQNNYSLTVVTATLTVETKAVTIKADDKTITYGDAVNFNALTYTHNGIVSGDTVDVTYTTDYALGANAGETFAIKPSLNGNYSNYVFNFENGTLTVVKRDATITAEDKTIVYGAGLDTITLTYAQENLVASAPDGVTLEVVDFVENSVPGTTFAIKATSSNENYNFTFVNGTLKVVKKDVIVTAGNATVVYGSEADLSAVTSKVVGLVGEDAITVTFTAPDYAPGANAGETFAIIPSSDEHPLYNFTFVNGTLTVTKRNATVTAGDLTITYGDEANLTAYEITGLLSGDSATVSLSTNYKPGNGVGTYAIEPLATNNNYVFTAKNGTLTVNPKAATVTALDKTISYGEVANLTAYEITGLLSGDSATVSLSTNYKPGNGVGTYEILPHATNSNYEFKIVKGTLTVNKAHLDITNATQVIETTTNSTYTFNKDLLVETFNGVELNDSFEYVGIPTYTVASTYQFTATLSHVNYEGSVLCTFIIKSVDVGGTLYTIEDALNVATSGNVIVKANTAFSSVVGYYTGSQYYTVKSGVTLLLPYKDGDTIGYLSGGDEGGTNYDSHPNFANGTNIQTVAQYVSLDIPSGLTVTVNGSLTVGALTGKQDAGTNQNEITGGYAQINLYGNMVVSDGKLRVIGYIKGAGTITTTGTSVVTENLYLSGWMGGTQSVAKYIGDQTVSLNKFLFGGSVNIQNPQAYPYNQYELRSIQSTLVINYGSSLQGWLKIATSGKSQYGLKAKINEAEMVIISSNASSAGVSNLRLLDSNAKITKSFANGRVSLVLDGNIADGYCTITINVLKATVTVDSQSVFFPIDGRTDVVVNSGTFTQSYKFKFLPGATLTIAKGATHTMNSSAQLIFYTKDFEDNATCPYPSAERGDAKFINNGTLNINGAFGGVVSSTTSGAKTVVGSGATLSVSSIESYKDGTAMDIGLSVTFTLAEHPISKTAQLSGGIDMATGTTYTYNGSAWA